MLAVYTEKDNAIAALKCCIGRGTAVLVGTHPELESKWLASQPDTVAIDEGLKDGTSSHRSTEEVREHVREELEKCSKGRKQFFSMLLHEAGLGEHIHWTLAGREAVKVGH